MRKKCRFHRGRLLHSVKAFLVSVKANLHPNLHRKCLFMSGLFLEVKGEGKKHKLAECAYTRVREGRNEWGCEQKQPSLMRKLRCFRKNMQAKNTRLGDELWPIELFLLRGEKRVQQVKGVKDCCARFPSSFVEVDEIALFERIASPSQPFLPWGAMACGQRSVALRSRACLFLAKGFAIYTAQKHRVS